MKNCCPECQSENVVGIEYQGLYDGVVEWLCQRCKHAWPRFDEDDFRTKKLHKMKENWEKDANL